MSTTLTNGLKLPDKGSVDWYADMQNNYTILDGAVGTIAEHTSALSGKAPLVHTHTKTDITDLFNSANTWSGEQTFSQTIQGNAATASAFDTAKPITLTGAVTGTVSGTNSWAIATALKTGTAITRGTVPAPYFKIASWEVAPNRYFGAILQIQNKCYTNNTATLTISVRTKTDATFQRGYSLLNNAIGMLPSEFILCYKEITGKVLCELYYYTTTPYNGIRFSVISEGIQNDSLLFNTMVVYRDPTGIAALPSDYTVIQTTIGTYTQDFIPYNSNTYDLGTSTNKWKSLNGLNPGALSLPSNISYDPINTRNWDLTGDPSTPNWYTPTVDGWLCVIAFAGTLTDAWLDIWEESLWGQSASQSPSGELFCIIPVRANINARIRVKASFIYDARLFVASGNV